MITQTGHNDSPAVDVAIGVTEDGGIYMTLPGGAQVELANRTH